MDSGLAEDVGANGPLQATGPNPVTKFLAENGLPAFLFDENGFLVPETFLDKTPPSGPGAGLMDTFTTALVGTGSQLTLTMTANLDFEAMGFDNIKITGVPEPGTAVLLLMGLAAMRFRRRPH